MSQAVDIKNIENFYFAVYRTKCWDMRFLMQEQAKFERLDRKFKNMTFDELAENADFVTSKTIAEMKKRNMPPLIVEEIDLERIHDSCALCNIAAHIAMCPDEEKKKKLIEAMQQIQKKGFNKKGAFF